MKTTPPDAVVKLINPDGSPTNYFFLWEQNVYDDLIAANSPGLTGTLALAKLTLAGANGSITLVNGKVTAKVDPT